MLFWLAESEPEKNRSNFRVLERALSIFFSTRKILIFEIYNFFTPISCHKCHHEFESFSIRKVQKLESYPFEEVYYFPTWNHKGWICKKHCFFGNDRTSSIYGFTPFDLHVSNFSRDSFNSRWTTSTGFGQNSRRVFFSIHPIAHFSSTHLHMHFIVTRLCQPSVWFASPCYNSSVH